MTCRDVNIYAVVIEWIGRVMQFEECLPSLDSSAFISCALTVNAIGLPFLRQCFIRLLPLTET
jgi:hypothetical protein